MKVGDLVSYKRMSHIKNVSHIGVVLRVPEDPINGVYEVLFGDRRRFCRGKLLEVVSEGRD